MSFEKYLTQLELINFSVFQNVKFDYVKGINALIGANGTGKSHILKALYVYHVLESKMDVDPKLFFAGIEFGTLQDNIFGHVNKLITECFQTDLKSLMRKGRKITPEPWHVSGKYGVRKWGYSINKEYKLSLSGNLSYYQQIPPTPTGISPVFIPATDMMNHSEGFTAASNIVRLDYDRTCKDIVNLMSLERKQKSLDKDVLKQLTSIMGGEIEKDDNDRFYIVNSAGKIPMPMAASGISRIATFARVYQNGWLPPGSTLFWDEPEISLNPPLMKTLVSILLALARSGVQIFLATHSYVILREIEVQAAEDDSFRYFALSQSDNGVVVKPADSYLEIEPNEIESEYADLYDRAIEKRLKAAQQ